MVSCLITGATGLLGRSLIHALLANGERVHAWSRTAEHALADLHHPNLSAKNIDISSAHFSESDLPDEEIALIMLAAKITVSRNMRELSDVMWLDTFGHIALAEAAVDRLRYGLFASSSTVYGFPDKHPIDESYPLAPWNVYALTKCATEGLLKEMFSAWAVPLGIARITQVYGPGAPLIGAMYTFLRLAHESKSISITSDPDAFRDYCHVDDVTAGLLLLLNRKKEGIYNLGSGEATTIRNLATYCLRAAGRKDEPDVGEYRPTGSMLLNIEKARRELGYTPGIQVSEGVLREYKRLYGNN
jgi:UDP-glucose 4-epimerase